MSANDESASNPFVALLGAKLKTKDASGTIVDGDTAAITAGKTVGLYFSAHWCGPCRGFTPELANAYMGMQSLNKPFEIVFVSSDKDESAFNEYYGEMPWKALPYTERDLKASLSKKYKVQGIPTLVIVGEDGKTITKDGRSAITEDPTGKNFPWNPPSIKECLGTDFLNGDGKTVTLDELAGKNIGIYFSAHWCPPCRGFTPELVKTYNKLKEANKNFEIIFASSDRDEKAFNEYFKEMPWLALPYADRERKERLSKVFNVEGIPTFVMLDADLNVINAGARAAVGADPEGENFPWAPKPVNNFSDDGPGDINDYPGVCVMASKLSKDEKVRLADNLNSIACKYRDEAKAEGRDPDYIFFTGSNEGVGERVLQMAKVDPANIEAGKVQLILMDIPDNGGYYVGEQVAMADVAAAVETFLGAYVAKALERQQLS